MALAQQQRRRYFAGVDGGATKTISVVASEDGRIVGFGRAGPSNSHNVGLRTAVSNLRRALNFACGDAGVDRTDVSCACFGLAGLDSPADEDNMRKVMSRPGFSRSNLVVHDSAMAISAALAGRSGVVVNAGTGSVAGGIDSLGASVRVGGWGSIIGDEGSAYQIGRRALQISMHAYDGRGPKTRLLRLLMRRLGCTTAEGIIELVYVKKMTVAQIAALAAVVTEAAQRGDGVAVAILEESGGELARMAATVARRLRLDRGPFMVATVGSAFASPVLLGSFKTSLRRLAPRARVVPPTFPQVVGALMLAMRNGGVETTPALTSALASSMKRLPKSHLRGLRSGAVSP